MDRSKAKASRGNQRDRNRRGYVEREVQSGELTHGVHGDIDHEGHKADD